MNWTLTIFLSNKVGYSTGNLIQGAIAQAFPYIQIGEMMYLEPNQGAFDTYYKKYDAGYLLKYLKSYQPASNIVPKGTLRIWVVHELIFIPPYVRVFGAANQSEAVVSNVYFPEEDSTAKEATHEVGHLLGLGHCQKKCVMRFSRSIDDVRSKPFSLCPSCQLKLPSFQ